MELQLKIGSVEEEELQAEDKVTLLRVLVALVPSPVQELLLATRRISFQLLELQLRKRRRSSEADIREIDIPRAWKVEEISQK